MLRARLGKQSDASGHVLALAYRNLWFWPLVPLVLCLGMASVEAELEARELLFHRAAGRGGTCGLMGGPGKYWAPPTLRTAFDI